MKRSLSSYLTALFAILVFVVVHLLISRKALSIYWSQVVQMGCIMAISSLGLNIIYGFNGQFSLGHIGFYAIGAYASALITKDWQTHWSGSKVGALSFLLAFEISLTVTIAAAALFRIGIVRRRVQEWLSEYVSNFEASFSSTLVALFLLAIAVAAGGGIGWLLWKILPGLLGSILNTLSPKFAQGVVFFLALLVGAILAAMVGLLVGMPLLKLTSDYFGIATFGFAIMVFYALQNADEPPGLLCQRRLPMYAML